MANNYNMFRGMDAVLTAYGFNKVAPWAVFVGKDPMFKYQGTDLEEGIDLLGTVMQNLIDNRMEGTYQLRMYEDVPPKGIMNNTPYSYSFRFQLYGDDEYGSMMNPMHAQLKQLREELKQLKEQENDDDDEDDGTIQGTIAGILKDPDTRRMMVLGVAGFIKNLFGKFSNGPAGMAGVNTKGMQEQTQGQPTMGDLFGRLSKDEQEKFNQAVYYLLDHDPNIGTNLLKLANLLASNATMYQSLTKMG